MSKYKSVLLLAVMELNFFTVACLRPAAVWCSVAGEDKTKSERKEIIMIAWQNKLP